MVFERKTFKKELNRTKKPFTSSQEDILYLIFNLV